MSYETSQAVAKVAAALVLAQSDIGGAKKGGTNPHFGSSFASLEDVWEAAKGPLAEHGLAVTQHPVSLDGVPGLRTVLWHSSGEWIASTIYAKPDKPGPQALGSLMTYLRRYSLQAVLGICSEDDDGEAATGAPKQEEPKVKPLTEDERSDFEAGIHFADTATDLRKVMKEIAERGVAGDDRDRLRTLSKDRMDEIEKEGQDD